MYRYLVLGAGRQGTAAAYDLLRGGGDVHLVDSSEEAVQNALTKLGLAPEKGHVANFREKDAILPLMKDSDGAVFAADYSLNLELTRWAIEARCHTVDYGGNHDVVNDQHLLQVDAEAAGVAIVPDTGLTPGLAGILVAGGVGRLEKPREARIRVGGLPQDPKPPLNYSLIFSVRGLTNEYLEESVVVEKGVKTTRPSMTELETLRFGDREFEAFLTSGGVSTLPETFAGVLDHLDCKTIRYPGHANLITFAFDIGFRSEEIVEMDEHSFVPRAAFEEMLLRSLPHNPPDETLMRVSVKGIHQGKEREVVYEMVDLYDHDLGFTSMQKTTAWPGSLILAMLVEGEIKDRGVLYQERVVDCNLLVDRLAERGVQIDLIERDL